MTDFARIIHLAIDTQLRFRAVHDSAKGSAPLVSLELWRRSPASVSEADFHGTGEEILIPAHLAPVAAEGLLSAAGQAVLPSKIEEVLDL